MTKPDYAPDADLSTPTRKRALAEFPTSGYGERAQTNGSPGLPFVGVISLWIAVCIALPIWVTEPIVPAANADTTALFVQFLVPLYAGTRIVTLLAKGAPRWLEWIFWLFSYIWLGLAGLAQEASGENPYRVSLTSSALFYGPVIVLLGMACYDIGVRTGRARARSAPLRSARQLDPKRVLVFLALTPVATLLLVNLTGGFSSLFAPRSVRSADLTQSGLLTPGNQATGGILTAMLISIPLVATVCSIFIMNSRPDLRRRPLWVALTAISLLLSVVVGNPVSNPRFWTGTIVLSILFSLRQANTIRGFRRIAMLVLAGLILVFPYADYFRYASGVHTGWQSLRALMTSKGDYDAPLQIATAVEFRHATGGTGGHQILGVLGFFVPRSSWPDKPGGTGALLSTFVNFPQPNVSSPLWIEAYVDGGLIALILGFLALGLLASKLTPHGWSHVGIVDWRYPLVAIVAGYSLLILRGSLLTSVGPLFAFVFLLWVLTKRAPRELGSDRKPRAYDRREYHRP